MARRKSIPILHGRASVTPPSASYKSWRIIWDDPVTHKRRMTSGGATLEEAELKAASLLGDYVPAHANRSITPPTLQEVFDDWVDANRHRWSSRTVDNYSYLAGRFLKPFGAHAITTISPASLRSVSVSDLSRGQQEKVRTLVRGTFTHAAAWLKTDAESFAKAVPLSGTRASGRSEQVSRGDIPSAKLVASFITTAYHTAQLGPLDDDDVQLDTLTGEKTRGSIKMEVAAGLGYTEPTNRAFIDGLPLEIVESMRRGVPRHYKELEKRRRDETRELAERFRQIALVTALGAGGTLRIGEVLALRVRHFLTVPEVTRSFALMQPPREKTGYRGRVEVQEQASQASKGKIWLTAPKGGRERTVHLPAFLPNWLGHGVGTHRLQVAQVVPRFRDESISLWEATDDEVTALWRAGFTPLGWMLWRRLEDLWDSPILNAHRSPQTKIRDYRDLLLFPTRNRARSSSTVQWEDNWPHDVRIVEGDGTYQAQSNFAKLTNPLYDYVADAYGEYPAHRRNAKTRQGWTHHGLRHFAASSRIAAGTPLPLIAREMGHSDGGFTLRRYGHVMGAGIDPVGYEF